MFIKMVFVVVFGFPNTGILQITKECSNEHRCLILNPSGSYIQTAISEHFISNSLSVLHILLIPIETLTCRYKHDCLIRKAEEAHLIHKAKTIEPLGMSKRDEL